MMSEEQKEDVVYLNDLCLELAFSGRMPARRYGWSAHDSHGWVVDLITLGSQEQRVGVGESFTRYSGLAALYAPETVYYEHCEGDSVDEAFMVFSASGKAEKSLREVTGKEGFCHIKDAGGFVAGLLQRLGNVFMERAKGSEFLASALMFETLHLIYTATPVGKSRRVIKQPSHHKEFDLKYRVNEYLKMHLSKSLQVSDLARAMGMSESSFAHEYSRVVGETPYQAIIHSKLIAAKRMLLVEGLTVKATSERLKFSSEFNFSRTFKRREGCSPSEYVKRMNARGTVGPIRFGSDLAPGDDDR